MSGIQTKIEFQSFSVKRFVAMLLLLIVGVLNFIIFGIDFGRHISTGSIMTFEGPSYFYASGLLPTIVAIFLLLYCLLSYFKGSIVEEGNALILTETRFRKKIETNLEKKKIVRMFLTNNEDGIKYLWLFLFVPYIIINYYYMMLNFYQPFIIGVVNITAITILISILLSAIALIILYAFPQWYLRIYTNKGTYELWFEPPRKKIREIALNLGIIQGERKELVEINPLKNFSKRHLLIASIFLGYGIFNVVCYMTTFALFQTIVCYFLIFIGIYLISAELRKLPLPVKSNGPGTVQYHLKSKYYQQFFFLNKTEKREVGYQHIDFEVFWGICTGALFMFIIFKIVQIWMILNSYNLLILLDNAILMTLIGGGILFLLGFHILVPEKTLFFRTVNFSVETPFLKSKERETSSIKENLTNIKAAFKRNFQDPALKKKFIKRIIFIISASIIGIIVLLWEYFFYFNLFNLFNF